MPTNDEGVSQYFQTCVSQHLFPSSATALDMPCGTGRHARWLAKMGMDVVGIDINQQRIDSATLLAATSGLRVSWMVADLEQPLSLPKTHFDLVVVIHYVSPTLFDLAASHLRPGGYFIFETFGGHGQNWRTLPAPGTTLRSLNFAFDVLDIHERIVGPTKANAAVKAFARRRFC